LRWAHEGNKLYKKRYPGKLDYVSKFNEAFTLFMSGACEEASKVLAEIRDNLDLKPWKAKVTDGHPAALYCNPQYAFLIHQMQCICYKRMTPQPGEGKFEERKKLIELANKERDECQSLLAQRESEGIFLYSRDIEKCRAEALEHAVNKKYGEYIPYMSTVLLVLHACQCRHYLHLCKVCGHVLHVRVRS
jgi:hypothetical protein